MTMEISWYGQSCFKIKGKNTSLITDPFDPTATGLKSPKDMTSPLVLSSHDHADHRFLEGLEDALLTITGPGEYEFQQVTVTGVRTFHDKSEGSERGVNTVYSILIDGVSIVHLGDLGHALTEEQLSLIGACDVLLIPVGGVYTITAEEASRVVSQLEPRIVIPMHYKIEGLKYELDPVENFLKAMAAESVEPVSKLTITKDKLPEETTVVVLSKS